MPTPQAPGLKASRDEHLFREVVEWNGPVPNSTERCCPLFARLAPIDPIPAASSIRHAWPNIGIPVLIDFSYRT